MVPRKTVELIKPTAEATNVSIELVQDLLSFYWIEVRKAIIEMRGHNIFVDSLGTFRMKFWKVPEVIEKYERMIAYYEKKQVENKISFQRFAIMKELQIRLERVNSVHVLIKQDLVKKQEVKEKRKCSKT